jgi:aspartyl-tRNA synthetase
VIRQPAGALRAADAGRKVLLQGWVARRRDLGELIFLMVRDRSGLCQVVFDAARCPKVAVESSATARLEDVVEIEGEVVLRDAAQKTAAIETGEVEIVASRLEFLGRAETPPFLVEDRTNATEELRLQYRYLDLRRPAMQKNLLLRDEITFRIRKSLREQGFVEVETPMLTRSTPEGARDFLVPSRLHPGRVYALPQSPQIFKQLLMVAGLDRYFQIARCFRDEDLRADRQYEFTQIDLEMSFPTEEAVFGVVEAFLAAAFSAIGVEAARPFPRLTYRDAIETYGTDRPDLRFGLPLADLSEAAAGSGFAPMESALSSGGAVRGLRVPGGASLSRKRLDELTAEAKTHGAAGLLWIKRAAGEVSSPAKKGIAPAVFEKILERAGLAEGDLLLLVAGPREPGAMALGALRNTLGRELSLIDSSKWAFAWVTEFPLVGQDAESGGWYPMNHPFTAPRAEDLPKLEGDPGSVRALAYDVVCNGWELGSGSIRIHRADIQERIFRLLGISEAEGRERFGFLLEAFRYGAPPHGGIALGLDRICALAAGAASLREIIAFPKTTSGLDLMMRAPSEVPEDQWKALHITPERPQKS